MSDNITLPRVTAQEALEALQYAERRPGGSGLYTQEIANLRTALAAPEPVRHPGYVIGNHWLETAYERLCAGEAEDAILEDYELVRKPRLRELRLNDARYHKLKTWLYRQCLLSIERCRIDTPESLGDWWILRKPKVIDGSLLIGYGETEDAAIDAAMEDKT